MTGLLKYLRMSGDANNIDAPYFDAVEFGLGHGYWINLPLAHSYLRRSSEQAHIEGQYVLAVNLNISCRFHATIPDVVKDFNSSAQN
jgi:hypothetical protein